MKRIIGHEEMKETVVSKENRRACYILRVIL